MNKNIYIHEIENTSSISSETPKIISWYLINAKIGISGMVAKYWNTSSNGFSCSHTNKKQENQTHRINWTIQKL